MNSNLSVKEERFAQEYLVDLNGMKAAIRAGYSVKTASSQASRLLTRVKVQECIQGLMAERSKRCEVTADKVLKEFAKIAFIDIRKFYHENGILKLPNELDEDAAAAIAEISINEIWGYDITLEANVKQGEAKKVKTHDKLRALENIAKHLGWYEKDNGQQSKVYIQPTAAELKVSRNKLQNDY